MNEYTEFRYIYPPRTTSTILEIGGPAWIMWQKYKDAIAQFKLNGSRNVIFISPERKIEFWNRHKEQQRGYTIPKTLIDQILALNLPPGWTAIDSELLHFKTKEFKDVVYMYDLLVIGGQYLLDETYEERHKRLVKLFNGEVPYFNFPKTVDGKIYVAQNIPQEEWENSWNRIQDYPACEGLVLKRTGGVSRLRHGYIEQNNTSFMCRLRKPSKKYQGTP